MSEWYALCTGPQQERRVAAGVAEREFSFFLPMETIWADTRRAQRTMRPVFRGYVFVLCDLTDLAALHGIEGVTGLFRYLRDDGLLWPRDFPAGVILGLQIDERAGAFDATRDQKPQFKPKKGERVKIAAGPYFNFFAKVLATPRGKRVQLLVEGFDKPRHRTEDVEHLSAA
jgi:transcription antitermination factor NusG